MKQRYLEDLNYFLNCANQKRGKKLDKKFPNETIHLDFYFLHSKEELNDFIDEIRKTKELEEDLESENGLYSGAKGNNSLELENTLRDFLLNEYM